MTTLNMRISTEGVFSRIKCKRDERFLLDEIYRLMQQICTRAHERVQVEVVEDFAILCIEPVKPQRLEVRRAGL